MDCLMEFHLDHSTELCLGCLKDCLTEFLLGSLEGVMLGWLDGALDGFSLGSLDGVMLLMEFHLDHLRELCLGCLMDCSI